MRKSFVFALALLLGCLATFGQTKTPLRIFIRAGVKTHGPDQHDHPRFLKEWVPLLNERGAHAEGAMDFPTAEQLAATDVLVMFAADAGNISPEQRVYLDTFLKRGGGIVAIHDAVCGNDAQWYKTIIGGAWEYNHAKFFEGNISMYFMDRDHPITRDASNFDFDDEMYYDLTLMPEAHILAGTYQPDERNRHDGRILPSIYDVAPQMWTYEKDNYRAFVAIPGHNYKTFDRPNFRAILLRGIAWAGKRDVDLLASKAELADLRYPEGGPTAPDQAVKKIVVPPDFNINLVASEPLIEKPISMDWDASGRLWVAETPEYPFRNDRTRAPYDRISILESTTGNGVMDKKTVFYEGLDLVTSLVLYEDGVIVSQAPYIYRLRDTHHTGKADVKEILYAGFGTNDTHAVISNLRWGMDGWIYATVGYSRGDVYSADHKTHFGRISDGVFRFRPDGSAIEQVSSKGSNTWGEDSGPDGEIFFTQANGNHIDHVVMPESALARGRVGNTTSFKVIEDHNRSYPLMSWTKQAYLQIDWVGNFTAAAGCCIYDGGAWPEKYNYTHYVAEPTINIVHQDILKPVGVSYVASKDPEREDKEFVASTDLWFRPIHQRVGPDGALYILDFYNQAAVHNDTRGTRHDPRSNASIRPDRDHYFGRIWRVQNKEAKTLTVPALANAKPVELVKALEHPNEWVRMTALRLLVEAGGAGAVPALEEMAASDQAPPLARVHALWVLADLEKTFTPAGRDILAKAINSPDVDVCKNALRIRGLSAAASNEADPSIPAVINRINDPNQRIRLEAIIAIGHSAFIIKSAKGTGNYTEAFLGTAFSTLCTPEAIHALVKAYPDLNDPWLESAVIGAASANPVEFINTALDSSDPAKFTSLAAQLAGEVGGKEDADEAARLVVLIGTKPMPNELKRAMLERLTRELKVSVVPAPAAEWQNALRGLLGSPDDDVAMLALPLAARWDKSGALANESKAVIQPRILKLNDASLSDDQRGRLVTSLLAARNTDATILPAVAQMLGGANSPELQKHVINALGGLPDAAAGQTLITAYPLLSGPLQDTALNQLLKRAEWSLAVLDAVQAQKVSLAKLGPVAINHLRTHSDPAVAARANKLIDEIRGPETKEKDALIAKFTPIVVQPGDAAHGKQLFTQNCAICHSFNGAGKDIAPDLTGMGAHGPAELIIHVLDPNREVEPNYYAYSIETKDGEIYDGVIARENQATVTLRSASGDMQIKVADIKSRRNTGLSLMPNGFEALGGENLRDILAYLCAGDSNYRLLDLHTAFTATSSKGNWISQDQQDDRLDFRKFGLIKVDQIPFEIVNPLKSASGNNLIVLKGGEGFAKTRPQKVEIPNIGVKASKLHFLGGVGGWAYPIGDKKALDIPVVKVTVHYADGQNEEIVLRNGREFADWIDHYDVPDSKPAPGLVKHGQVRWFTKALKHYELISSITLESYDNDVAPAFVAITAETAAPSESPRTAEAAKAADAPADAGITWGAGTHVLIVGGGSSHDFNRWFNEDDSATLTKEGQVSVRYTSRIADVAPALKNVDCLYLTSNQAVDADFRKAIFDFADSGRVLMLVHPALWYNWQDWPEYNRELIGGGAHGHDRYGEFEVILKKPEHPLLAGMPATFKISDELYHTEVDPKGSPMEVLAEGRNPATGATYPLIWIVHRGKSRIVCCTLGHDGKAHDLAPYKTFIQNCVKWAGEK